MNAGALVAAAGFAEAAAPPPNTNGWALPVALLAPNEKAGVLVAAGAADELPKLKAGVEAVLAVPLACDPNVKDGVPPAPFVFA